MAWDASPSPGIASYIVRYGTASGVYSVATNVGNKTAATVAGLQQGQTYYLAVTAQDAAGIESLPSNEASYQVPTTPAAPPQITLNAPLANASFSAPATINCAAGVIANGHTITKVQFYNGSTLLGEDTSAPYSLAWNSVAAGNYVLTAQVVYDSGSVVASTAANIVVTNPLPAIALTAPASGVAPAILNLSASVTANGHTITKVQFYNGSTLLGEDATSPYGYSWTGVAAGTYSVKARLVYDSSSTLDSAAASVSVTNPLPTIVLTSPTNNASYSAPASVSIAANITANGRTITKVLFYNSSTLLGEDTSVPYSFTWTNVSAGNYTLLARAVYDSGSTVDSTSVSIAVNGLPAPWQTVDIGAVGVAGSASAANGVYSLRGAGSVSGTADSFRFVYQTLSADGEIKAQLTSLPTSGTSGSFGVMIRETLTVGSRYAYVGLSQDLKFRWQRRSSTSGSTSSTTSTQSTLPNTWVRLVRAGNTITGYKSTDGKTWAKVSSRSIAMAANIYIGYVVASGSPTNATTVTFGNGAVVP